MQTSMQRQVAILVVVMLVILTTITVQAGDAPRITPDEVKDLLDDPQVLIIDVRSPRAWRAASKKIQGAIREIPAEIKHWSQQYDQNQKTIVYCS